MNKVCLIGRLTKDIELKTTQSNVKVANFTLAVNRRFVKEGQEQTADFINIIAWGKIAEFCDKYFGKGQQIGISGRIQTRTWDDDQGTKHYVTEVVAEEAYFADSRRDSDSSGSFENTFGTTEPGSMGSDFEVSSSSDDLPF